MALTPRRIAAGLEPAVAWRAMAQESRSWAREQGVAWRDVVVLVPFAQLLGPARRAFAAGGGWMPRIETTHTLAEALAPPPPVAQDGPIGDPVVDRLRIAALLRGLPEAARWERDDRRAFAQLVARTVDAAHALLGAVWSQPPPSRPAAWAALRIHRARLSAAGLEGALLQAALEWAALAGAGPLDALFDHHPAGWVVVRVGGVDRLAETLASRPDAPPALGLDTDFDIDVLGDDRHMARPRLLRCTDAESEARACVAAVVDALDAGHRPVAIAAIDRERVRRVRALLERIGVEVDDETGWRLSTTRAAARLQCWLRIAREQASADDRLEWIKGLPVAAADPAAAQALERRWRRGGASPLDPQRSTLEAHLDALQQWAAGPRRRPLDDWLRSLRRALDAADEWAAWRDDAAGVAVLRALRLEVETEDPAWTAAAAATHLDLAGFGAWADETLDAEVFRPASADAPVVITPLARLPMRPFGAVVAPGADAEHLGRRRVADGLIGEGLAAAAGLETADDRLARERLAFAQLMRQPRATILWRRMGDGDEQVDPAADVLRLAAMLLRQAPDMPPIADAIEPTEARLATPVRRPAPAAADALPETLSASQVEALRACPYRFFGQVALGLGEDEEAERAADPRDWGQWLHAVLHRFHRDRADDPGVTGDDDLLRFERAVDEETRAHRFDAADLLPWLAGLEAFTPAYLDWLHAREAQGWRWRGGELELQAAPAALAPTRLRGRIDRIDAGPAGRQALLDYKTGRKEELRKRVKIRTEDTQLAFYAALLHEREPQASLEAAYVALDETPPELVGHSDVTATAASMVQGLAADLRRLRGGAGLPALGEGRACERCAIRGLCRRDQWSDP